MEIKTASKASKIAGKDVSSSDKECEKCCKESKEIDEKVELKGIRSGNIIDESICPDIWKDNITPIVSTGKRHDVYIYTKIFPAGEYSKLIHLLLYMVTEEDIVILHINTSGGLLDGCKTIYDAIKECKATTICKLSGTVASAGTIIALACDEIEMGDYCCWMTHYYSSEIISRGNELEADELEAQQEFMSREIERMFYEIYAGFFSKEEIKKIIDGRTRWLNKTEVLKRWANKDNKSKDKSKGAMDEKN